MLAQDGGTVADKTGPRVGGACKCWASPRGGWSYIKKVNKVSVTVEDNWGNGGRNFTRVIPFDKLADIMTPEQVQEARDSGDLCEQSGGIGVGFRLYSEHGGKATPQAEAPANPPMVEQMKAM